MGIREIRIITSLTVPVTLLTVSLSHSPPLATRLLAHKIQSPQEWEAMQALTVRRHELYPA